MIGDDPRIKAIHSFIEREEYHKAWPLVSEFINESPENPKAIYLAGWVLRSQGHVGMALHMFRRALALESKVPNIWMHYGSCLHDTHQYELAREAFSVVAKALPTDPQPLANIGATFVQQGKAREAVEFADKALALDPQNRIARIAKSYGCLALGRWADGWEHAEALYGDRLNIRVYTENDEPVWDGSKGKTVVVQADQGLGDMIMFAQCLPEMIRDCKKVIVETNPRLAPVFARQWPEIDVYDTLKQDKVGWPTKYEIDAHIHISWLGRYYRKTDADFPRKPYLTPEPELVEAWKEWLKQFPKPWVGLTWKGGIPVTNNTARSATLETLDPILQKGGTFISLAYQDVGREIALYNWKQGPQVIVPPLNNGGDYGQTMALIAALDHVITVTTTVAHACGAMGKRAYVLVNRRPQWRYVYGGDHLIWYPESSLQLYRQKPGEEDWTHTVKRVAEDYQNFVLPLAYAA